MRLPILRAIQSNSSDTETTNIPTSVPGNTVLNNIFITLFSGGLVVHICSETGGGNLSKHVIIPKYKQINRMTVYLSTFSAVGF